MNSLASGVVWCLIVAASGIRAGGLDYANVVAPRQSGLRDPVVATENVIMASKASAAHLRVDDSVGDILQHPAFAGFARLLLPWDDRRYDTTMTLRNIGSLLPYHTHVDPAVVVSSLNRMIDDASSGKTIFFDIYTDAEKQAEPSRKDTGLFFFRGKAGAPFAVVSPGGGFAYVGSLHEGFPYAVEINKGGYNAFVLKYRAGRGATIATQDLAAALTYIFRNAAALGVTTADYSLWGSSAGARMAAGIGSYGTARFGGPELPKPSALVILYTGHSDLASTEPPTFVAVGDADAIALRRPWNGEWRRCANWAPTSSIGSTGALVTVSDSEPGRRLKDGSEMRCASGPGRLSESDGVIAPRQIAEVLVASLTFEGRAAAVTAAIAHPGGQHTDHAQ